jgi:hypothetical protein
MPRYKRFMILGHSSNGVFWHHDVWRRRIFPGLDRLVRLVECDPSIHCRQITKAGSKEVKFGKLRWTEEDAAKWCHGSELTAATFAEWIMVDVQVHCPPKKALVEKMDFPSLYVQVEPLAWAGVSSRTVYDQGIHVAMKLAVYEKTRQQVDDKIKELAQTASAVAVYRCTSRVHSLNSFESLVREDFVYRGMLDDELPDLRRMKGKWSKWE